MPLDYNDFAEQIKQKYPEYKDVDNYKLATAMVQKYPEYKTQVDLKKKEVSQSTLVKSNTSSGRLSSTTTKPTASLSSPEILTDYLGKSKKKYKFEDNQWYEENPKPQVAKSTPSKYGGTNKTYGEELKFNPNAAQGSWKPIEEESRVKALNYYYKKEGSLANEEKVFTNYDPEKKDNLYRIQNGQWERKVPKGSFAPVNDEIATQALNKRYGQNVVFTPTDTPIVKKKEDPKFMDINSNFMAKTEEDAIDYLEKNYGNFGFEFTQEGAFAIDQIRVKTKDGRKEQLFEFDQKDPEQADNLRAFLEQNKTKDYSDTYNYLKQNAQASTAFIADGKLFKVEEARANAGKFILSDDYSKNFKKLSEDEMKDQITNVVLKSGLTANDIQKFYQTDAYKAYKAKKVVADQDTKQRINDLYDQSKYAKLTGDKAKEKDAQNKIDAYLTNDVIADNVKNYDMQLNDLKNRNKQLETEYSDYEKQVNKFNSDKTIIDQKVKSGKISREQYNGMIDGLNQRSDELNNLSENIQTKAQKIKLETDNVSTSQKKLNYVAGKYVAAKEKEGSTIGFAINSILNGVSGAFIEPFASLSAGGFSKYDGLSPEDKQYYKDKKYTRNQVENILDNKAMLSEKNKVKQMLISNAGFESTTQEYMKSEDRGFIATAIGGVLQSLPAMALGVVGKAASFTGLAAQAYSGIEEEMLTDPDFQTTSVGERSIIAIPYAIGMGILENAGLTNMIKGNSVTGKALQGLVTRTIANAPKGATQDFLNKLVTKEIESNLAKGVIKITQAGLAEFETGATQSLVLDQGLKQIYNVVAQRGMTADEKKDLSQGEFFDTADSFGELVGKTFEDGLAEMIGGVTLGAVGTLSQRIFKGNVSIYNADDVEFLKNVAGDDNFKKLFVTNLKTSMLNGSMTKGQAQEKLDALNEVQAVFTKLPENISKDQVKQAMDLVVEKTKLDKEIAGKDPALVAAQTERINAINEELKTISQNAVQEQTTSEVSVQPGAEVSGEMAQGESQAGSQVATQESQKVEIGGTIRGYETISGDFNMGDVRNLLPEQNNGNVVIEGFDGAKFAVAFSRKGADGKNIFEQGTSTQRPGYISASVKIADNATPEQVQAAQQEAQRNLDLILPTVVDGVINAQAVNDVMAQQPAVEPSGNTGQLPVTEGTTSPQVDITVETDQVATYRAEEQAELLKAIPKIESYKVNGEIDKTLMPKTVLAKYNKIYNKYDKLISPLLETIEQKKNLVSNQKETNLAENETGKIQPERTGDGRGRTESRSLTPLEGAPAVPGINGPDPQIVAVAEKYAADNGIDLKRQSEYVEIDEERAKRLADAYEQMADDPQNPKVKEAYQDLVNQTIAQYQALVDAGYKFWFMDFSLPSNEEYASTPYNALRDLRQNKEMGIFATIDGYGEDGITQEQIEANPMLADTGLMWPIGSIDGKMMPVLVNDLFRAMHDAFGHGLEGAGFRARGEENAWQAHVRLFTGPAIGAITSETRGQNSWVNFGPEAEFNRTASGADTKYAPQKVGLMPNWTWQEGRAGDIKVKIETPAPTTENQLTERNARTMSVKYKRNPIVRAAINVLKALPGVKIYLHEDTDQYSNALANKTGDSKQSIEEEKSAGSYIDGEIHLDMSQANLVTLLHEAFHHAVMVNGIKGKYIIDMAKGLRGIIKDKARLAELDKFISQYEEETDQETLETRADEFVAQLGGILAANQEELTTTGLTKFMALINRIFKKLGLGNVFTKASTSQDAVNFINAITRGLNVGEDVSGSYDPNTGKLKFQADFSDPLSKLTFVYDKNKDDFKKLEKDGYITYDNTIADFAGKYMFLHQPDAAFSGMIYKNGELLVEGKGGVYYPIKFHKDGYFWASTSNTAKKMAEDLNKVLEQNGGTIYMALTSAPSDKLMSSTTMSNAILDFFSSKAFDKNFKINQAQLKQALITAANDTKQKRTVNKETGKASIKNAGLNLGIKPSASISTIQSLIKSKLNPDNSSFGDRKNFAEELIKLMSDDIKNNPEAVNQFGKLFSEGIQNKYFKGVTKTGKLSISKANMVQAISEMFTEPLLKEGVNRESGGQVYAVIELNGPVKPVDSDKHESYPKAIQSDSDAKVIMHILQDRRRWSDVFEDFENDSDITKEREAKIFPTSGVSVRGLRVKSSVITAPTETTPASKRKKQLVYHGGDVINESDLIEGDPLYVSQDKKQAELYAKEHNGSVAEFDIDETKIADEELAYELIDKLGLKAGEGWVPKELSLYELIDPMFEETAMSQSDINKLFEEITKRGYDGIKFTDSNLDTYKQDIENYVIIDPKKTIFSKRKKQLTTDKDTKPGYDAALEALGETEAQREAWRKNNKVNQKQKRNPIVEQAVKDYFNEEITQEQYLDVVAKNQPIKPFKKVPALPSLGDITNSLDSSKVATGIIGLTKNLEDGEKVASRLDIPAYEDYDTWVVSLHDGNKEGKSIAYGQTAVLKNVNFKTFPGPAIRIAMGTQNKSTIGRIFGEWFNEDPEVVHARAKELMNDPAWTQVGMNPFRYSWFYDKADGMPLASADEVVQVGALVLAKNAKKVSPSDPMFETKSAKGGKIKFQKAPKILGQKPTVVIVKDEAKALIDQIKLEVRAQREQKKAQTEVRKSISDSVKAMVKKGSINLKQASTIISTLNRVNLDNPEMVKRFNDYIAKVFDKAEYIDKVEQAIRMKRKIKQNLKGASNPFAIAAKGFSQLEPKWVENIDEYIAIAQAVYDSVRKSTARKGVINWKQEADFQTIAQYVFDEEARQTEVLLGNLRSLYERITGKSSDTIGADVMQAELKDLNIPEDFSADVLDQIEEKLAEFEQMVEDTDPEVVQKAASIDPAIIPTKEAIRILDALDTYFMNGSIAGLDDLMKLYTGKENAIKFKYKAKPLRAFGSEYFAQKKFQSIVQFNMIFERKFRTKEAALAYKKASGIQDIENGANKAEAQAMKKQKEYMAKFGKIKGFNSAENIFQRGALANLLRTMVASEEMQQAEFDRNIEILRNSIDTLNEGNSKDKRKAVEYKKVLTQLGVFNSDVDIEMVLKNANQENINAVNFVIDMFGEIVDPLSDLALGMYNQILTQDVNYTPYVYKMTELAGKYGSSDYGGVDKDGKPKLNFFGTSTYANQTFDKNKAGVLMPITRPKEIRAGMHIDLDFDNNMFRQYRNALVDLYTAGPIRQLEGFFGSEQNKKILGSNEDQDIIYSALVDYIRTKKGTNFVTDDGLKFLNKITDYMAQFGAARALVGIGQFVNQFSSGMTNTIVNAGEYIRPGDFSKDIFEFMANSGRSIANVGGDEILVAMGEVDKSIERADLDNRPDQYVLKFIAKENMRLFNVMVAYPDAVARKLAWMAYYRKSMVEQGLLGFTESVDTTKLNDTAADYAQLMVDRNMDSTDAALRGSLFRNRNASVKIIRSIFLPFSSFGLNQKNRMWNDLNALASGKDIVTSARSIASIAGELVVYNAIRYYVAKTILGAALSLLGYDDDDQEELYNKLLNNAKLSSFSKLFTDIISPIPLLDNQTLELANKAMKGSSLFAADPEAVQKYVDKLKAKGNLTDEEIEKKKLAFEEKNARSFFIDTEANKGSLSIQYEKAVELMDIVSAWRTGEFVDDNKNERFLSKESREKLTAPLMMKFVATVYGTRELDQIANKSFKLVKDAESMSSTQQDNYKEVKKELGRDLTEFEMAIIKKKRTVDTAIGEINFIKKNGGLNKEQGSEYLKLLDVIPKPSPKMIIDIQNGQKAEDIIKRNTE
jgi:hypothetical protein